MATLQDVLKENKELQKKQNTTTKVMGNPASPYNKAVQTGNPNVQPGRQQISVTPTAQKQTYTTPLQAQTAASRKAVDLVGNAIGSGVSQTLSGISNIAKSVPVATEMGAKAISNLADAPVSPMTSKLTASEIKPKEDNFVKNFTNALFGSEKEQQTVETPTAQTDVKNRFQNVANREMIAQGEQPVKQITEWTDPWNNALEQNVENAQDFGQRYTQAVKPVTDFLDNASQKVDTYLNENVAPNLSTTEQFVTQAVGNAIPNFARQTLLGAVSGGSVPLLSTLSDVAMFLPSFYQGYEEGKQRGLSDEEAYFNAILRGGIEAGSEHLSDVWMVNGGQSQFDEWLLNKIALSGMNPFAKFVGKNMVSGIGESMEEVAARLGNTITDRAIYGDNIDVGQLALGSLEDAGAAFISTMVLGLLGGQYTNNAYRQYQNDVNRIQTENSIQEQLNSDANKYKTEMALVYANMTDEQKAQYLLQAQEQIAQKDPSDPVANMDIEELKDWVDRNAEKQIMGLTEEQYAKFIDRMNGAENPIAQTRLPNGQTFDVYEYLGNRTVDQEKAIDLGNRMGKNIIIADELPMGQNALTLGDGTVIISADAKRPATALAFHEMFHSLKDNGQWEDLMGFAYETMTKEKGYENFLEDLVSRYVGYYGNIDNNYLNSIASSVDLTNEQKRQEVKDYLREQGVNQYYTDANFRSMIDEEVAADFMERFNNEDTIKAMYNRSGNMAEQMWQKLIDAVESFTGMLTQDEENLRKTEQMFADVARQNYEEAKNDIGFADDGSVYPMYSATTWNALGGIGKRQIAEEVAKQTNTEIGVAMKWIDDINSVAAIIGANKDRLDYTPNNAYTALKNDQDYIYTIDMSTLCKKRILLSNTIDEIQKMLPNVTLTGDDYIRIRQMMKDKGYEVACGFCYVESRRKFLDTVAQQFIDAVSGNPTVTNKRQLAVSSELKNKDTYIPTLYDLTTADGSNALMNEHPDVYSAFVDFNNARGQNRVKLIETRTEYNGEIMKITEGQIKKLIRQGGLRLQSYSDFETPHLIDMMQVVADMSRRGLTSQAYTKVPNFADAFGETGIKINESLVVTGVDENGELIYDDVEGMPHEIAFALRQKHPENVGTIVVGKDDETILAAMADPKIDFIIPFHKSGWKNEEYANLGIAGYKDYTNYQNERDVVSGKADVGNFYPMDYWDFSVSGDENAKTYLRMCEEQGRIPKFDNFLTKDREGHWVAPGGYWKTLIDFKMYNNDGVGAPQRVVTPTFDDAVNQRILDEYEGDHKKYSPKMDIVNEFIREKGYRYSLSDQELDEQYFDALNRGDKEEARRLLNERANERGYTDRAYHGTQDFGFTVPDTQYSDDKLSFFATDDPTTAGTYSGNEYVRPISGNDAEAKQNEAKGTVDDLASLYPEDFPHDSNEMWDVLMRDALRAYDEWNGDEVVIRKWLHDDLADWREEAFDDNAPESVLNAENDVIEAIQNYVPISYAEGSTNGIYDLLINPEGLLDVDANNSNWNQLLLNPEDIGTTEDDAFFDEPYRDTRDLVEFAEYHGYPGYRLRNVYDDGGYGEGLDNPATVYALFNPQSQVKSNDLVTYDDEGNIIPPSQRYNANNPDIRYSLDNEYMDAMANGDEESKSRIIDEAARSAGYNIKVYHGTPLDMYSASRGVLNGDEYNSLATNYADKLFPFTIFRPDSWRGSGVYTSTDKGLAKEFSFSLRNNGGTTYDLYAKVDNPLHIDAKGSSWMDIDPSVAQEIGLDKQGRVRINDILEYAKDNGYDGVIADNILELGNGDILTTDVIVFNSNQLKSADPETYDENGDIILPSQRFNEKSDNILYSAEEYIPESIDQANKYPDRRYQQTKGDMKVLGDIDRENNNTEDPERTQDVRPETFIPPFEPSDIKSYNELFEDGHEERNPNKEELEFYQSLNEKLEKGKGGNSAGGAIGFLTPDQYFDHAVGRNTEQRKILDEKFGRPMFEGKKVYTQNIREKNDGLKQIVEETGIYGGTDESAAVQWYGEGQKPIGDNKVEPYTLDDLKRDFPEKWEDIVKMEQYMRKQYDEYVDRWNAMLTQIYPHPERMLLRNINSWRQQLDQRRSELELTDPNDVALVEDLKEQIAKLEQKIADGEDAYRSGDYLRNKRLQPRKDYFHHIREVEQNGFGNVKNILQAITQATGKGNIDPDLVDVSQYTQPRTKWSGILQRRNSNDYTADAVTSFARYVNEAEYAIAMNPVISQYRDEISKIRKATKQTKNANTMIDYLAKYTNDLAGKTNYLDTAMREFLGGEGNRNALLTAVEAINRRGKANAVVGNLRSAIAQFYNIPNALSVIKSLPAWRKGFNDYMSAKAGNRELLDQSPFLAERYGGLNEKDFQARDTVWKQIEGKLSDFSNKMMEFGDREATELIWLSAYNEGLEKGVDDPVYYADSMARRAVGGRGIGEVPFGMNSKLVGLFAPFQVEANNQWQNLKGMIEDKDADGIFRLMLGSYLMNILARAIFNDGVLPDPLEALEEGIRRLFAKDREDSVGQIMGDTAKRVAGETVSMIPGTSLWLPLVMGDNAETFFGDSDPTRYGTGTVGVKNLFDVAADAINGDGFDAVTPLLNLGLPYGGKQVSRMYNTLQDLNVLPSNGFMNTPFGGEKNPTAGSYSNAGALRYQLPNEVDSAQDIVEIARALAFGSNSTDAAQEYFNNGNKPVLSKERVAKLREHPEVSAENYITYLKEAGTDDKQGISQQEAYDWLSSHNLSDEERNALWEMTSNSWQKSYDEYVPKEETPKEEKTETKTENKTEKKSGKPTTKKEFTDVADANNSGRLSQAEAYDWLNSQRLSDAEKEALWNLMGWKTDYATYASKH